MIVLSYLFSLF